MRATPVLDNARQTLLDAAIAVFARKGYAGTSIQDVLDAVELSKPTLYYHFSSKAGLFRAILDHAFDGCFQLMRSEVSGQPIGEAQFAALATALFRFATAHADLTRLVFASLFSAPGEIPAECLEPARRRRNFEFVKQLVASAQSAGELDPSLDVNDLAHGLLGAISHRVRSHLLSPETRLDRHVATRVASLFLNGARKRA